MYSFIEFDKMYNMDGVTSELLGTKSTWPKNNSLRATEITLKYYGLHKIAMNNWSPTTQYTTLSKDMATLVFNIGSCVQVNLEKLIFSNIANFKSGRKKNQKLPFPSLFFGLLYGQKPMMESNEYLNTHMQSIQFKIKEDDPVEWEEEKGKQRTKASVERMPAEFVVTEPETQPSSMLVSSTGLAQFVFQFEL